MNNRMDAAAGLDLVMLGFNVRRAPTRLPNTLESLPVHRQEALLWRLGLHLDYKGVAEFVDEHSSRECQVTRPWRSSHTSAGLTAVLGDDGRYHLCEDGNPLCTSSRTTASKLKGEYRHEKWCYWWTDGETVRVQAPARACDERGVMILGRRGQKTVRWKVRLTSNAIDPALVPLRQRCVVNATTEWPGYCGTDTAIGRIRAALTAVLGPLCHACGNRRGAAVDHDHFSGQVRGLLCIECNPRIDYCLHANDCAYASYLNAPPAAPLNLLYPKTGNGRLKRSDRQRIAYFGFDPLYQGAAATRRAAAVRPITSNRG